MSHKRVQECATRVSDKCPARVSYKSVPRECSTRVSDTSVLQECPTRVSYKNVPQECSTRESYKSVPPECPNRVSYNLIQSSPFRGARSILIIRVSHKRVLQDCSARVSLKSVLQECPTRVFYRVLRKSAPQDESAPQERPTRVSHKSERHTRCPTRVHKSVPQRFPKRMRPTRMSHKRVSHKSVKNCVGVCFRVRVWIRVRGFHHVLFFPKKCGHNLGFLR